MSSVEEVKAGVARFGDEVGQQVGTIRASAEALDRSTAALTQSAIESSRGYAASF